MREEIIYIELLFFVILYEMYNTVQSLFDISQRSQLDSIPISAFSNLYSRQLSPPYPYRTSASAAHFPVRGDRLNNLRSTLYQVEGVSDWVRPRLIVEYIHTYIELH